MVLVSEKEMHEILIRFSKEETIISEFMAKGLIQGDYDRQGRVLKYLTHVTGFIKQILKGDYSYYTLSSEGRKYLERKEKEEKKKSLEVDRMGKKEKKKKVLLHELRKQKILKTFGRIDSNDGLTARRITELQGKKGMNYNAVYGTLRRMVLEGELTKRRKGKQDTYYLPDDQPESEGDVGPAPEELGVVVHEPEKSIAVADPNPPLPEPASPLTTNELRDHIIQFYRELPPGIRNITELYLQTNTIRLTIHLPMG
ncbi:MAG: hypothetical protein GX796_12930 [Clostridiaceae bacterium]|nr:hypothetical protein [Clostridiaceae bacterium]